MITPGNPPITRNIPAANRRTLFAVIRKFRRGITNPWIQSNSPSYLKTGQLLYNWIVKPIASELEEQKIDTFMFCVGTSLRSLPFAALHDGEGFLVQKYAIATIPAFNLTETNYTDIRNGQVLAMGASEFAQQNSLPAVEVELSAITPQLWQGVAILNEEFTLANFQLQRKRQPFDIIHLCVFALSASLSSGYFARDQKTKLILQLQNLSRRSPFCQITKIPECSRSFCPRDGFLRL
ncbi:MAG: CHAT domain-containing protein [Prochloron sp. SP5CPC1]|nr:CHAT domain-containing protein [Candidatus Paraprochloron terpiosi SP5CPC1]